MFETTQVAEVFGCFPNPQRAGLLVLRSLIYSCAADLPQIGRLQETLKWGQPAYLTPDKRAATTLRLGCPKSGGFALYVHCQSNVIPAFRQVFPEYFRFENTRAVLFETEADIQPDKLRLLLIHALTYHLRKNTFIFP